MHNIKTTINKSHLVDLRICLTAPVKTHLPAPASLHCEYFLVPASSGLQALSRTRGNYLIDVVLCVNVNKSMCNCCGMRFNFPRTELTAMLSNGWTVVVHCECFSKAVSILNVILITQSQVFLRAFSTAGSVDLLLRRLY